MRSEKVNVRDRGRSALTQNCGFGILMGNDRNRVGEHFTTGAVIPVIMAEHQILDGLVKPFRDLGFEPRRGLLIDGIRDDDTFGRHQKYRIM
tara:strand:- start:123 stop:398 length:276 start_codon:yes stop_codon:yes gene_type:complete